ncbi:MAG: ribbon-helix-helix domain-containing protein [Actinomycetota bacterium]|nr:ribbon-helix-helix domain-containing protein [Actinomycetota bacterium]
MERTTIYLSTDEAEGLRRVSAQTGTSESELIRRGLRTVLELAPQASAAPGEESRSSRASRPRPWTSFGHH